MDGKGNVLITKLTSTAEPSSAKSSVNELLQRGVQPKAAFVDKDCCGAWARVLKLTWPNIQIRLDSLHAMKRLTQTTISTQHPSHGIFCADISRAIFSDDEETLQRLRSAWSRQHRDAKVLPKTLQRKIVPRYIRQPAAIIAAVD